MRHKKNNHCICGMCSFYKSSYGCTLDTHHRAKNEQLKELLQAALCPNIMKGCQEEPCQWCEKRKQALNLWIRRAGIYESSALCILTHINFSKKGLTMETTLTAICPCGQSIEIPKINSEYDIMSVKCPNCEARISHGNTRTGEIYSWSTAKQIARANAEYRQQMHSVDMNEFYGRGNW